MAIPRASSSFAERKCRPCEGGVKPLTGAQAASYLKKLGGWSASADGKSIGKEYRMLDFMAAVQWIRRIARLAEKENHHPDIHLTNYRKIKIELSTHAIGGLSENDFILASKIDRLPKSLVLNKIV